MRFESLEIKERELLLKALDFDKDNLVCEECGEKTGYEKCCIMPPLKTSEKQATILCESPLCITEYLTIMRAWGDEAETIMRKEEMLRIVEKVRKDNPYPDDIFIEPSKEDYWMMKTALSEKGLIPDGFFGSYGRRVWNNCLDKIAEILLNEEGG